MQTTKKQWLVSFSKRPITPFFQLQILVKKSCKLMLLSLLRLGLISKNENLRTKLEGNKLQ